MNELKGILSHLGVANGVLESLEVGGARPGLHFKCELNKFDERREELQQACAGIGYSPVMVGSEQDWSTVAERMRRNAGGAERAIADAESIDGQQWLEEAGAQVSEVHAFSVGKWPQDITPCREFTRVHTLRESRLEPVHVLAVPTARSFEVPAFLGFGDIGRCPPSAVHVAMFKRWHALFGAEVAIVTGNSIEAAVGRPPVEQPAALALAMEHAVYCPDVIYEATEELSVLAALLLHGTRWTFWWSA